MDLGCGSDPVRLNVDDPDCAPRGRLLEDHGCTEMTGQRRQRGDSAEQHFPLDAREDQDDERAGLDDADRGETALSGAEVGDSDRAHAIGVEHELVGHVRRDLLPLACVQVSKPTAAASVASVVSNGVGGGREGDAEGPGAEADIARTLPHPSVESKDTVSGDDELEADEQPSALFPRPWIDSFGCARARLRWPRNEPEPERRPARLGDRTWLELRDPNRSTRSRRTSRTRNG